MIAATAMMMLFLIAFLFVVLLSRLLTVSAPYMLGVVFVYWMLCL